MTISHGPATIRLTADTKEFQAGMERAEVAGLELAKVVLQRMAKPRVITGRLVRRPLPMHAIAGRVAVLNKER